MRFFAFILLASSVAFAQVQHEPTAQELLKLKQDKDYDAERIYTSAPPEYRLAADTSDFKYVLLSSEAGFSEASNLRYTIAQNLPADVKLVLLVDPGTVDQVKRTYSKYISLDRVIFAVDPNMSNGFWARDAFPNPVVNPAGQLSLVSAKYYRDFQASDSIARAVNVSMAKYNFTFVGGNIIADENANCFSIDSYRRFNSTEADLKNAYGCKVLHVMRHVAGIGDVDEVLKPLGNGVILTNAKEYVADLTSWGYKVVLLPAIPNSYRTYANSLVVGKTVFMPVFGVATDAAAKKVYEDLGYKVVGITSNTLSDSYHGSVHCQTMAYPAVSETQLLSALGLNKVN